MRASFVWEAGLVSLLIIIGVGAVTAWNVVRLQSRNPEPTIVQPGSDAVVRKAMEAVELCAKFALKQNGDIFVDHSTIEKTLSAARDEHAEWNVTGAAWGESIDATKFRWIVRITETKGVLTLQQVRLNGDVVYSREENATAYNPIRGSPACNRRTTMLAGPTIS